MDASEVFLSCNNLTLEQYRTIVLSRALTGAGGCVVSIAVLVTILLRRAWESLTKRVYVANVIYSLLYCSVAIAGVNYSHPPSLESAMCEAMGFLLHYSGTLVMVHYCVLALIAVLSVYQAVREKDCNLSKLGELFLFLILFLCPLLNSWEPFLPQIPSYGNYGPLCWFRLELTDNCTYNRFNERFLEAIPNAVVCFGNFVLISTVLLTLCGMYCKFRGKTTGAHIIRVIPTIAILALLTLVMMLWFLLSAVRSEGFGKIGSFSAWLKNVTVTTATNIGMLLAVGIYVHFPTHLCKQCWTAVVARRGSARQNEELEQQPAYHPEHNPPESRYSNHADCETAPLIPHPPKASSHYNSSNTRYNSLYSPVTTNPPTAALTTHPPEVEHHNNPSHTCCSISHEPLTTNTH